MTASKMWDSRTPPVSVTTSHWPEVVKSGRFLTLRTVVLHQSPTKHRSLITPCFGDVPVKGWGCQEQAGSLGSCMSPLKLLKPTLHLFPGDGIGGQVHIQAALFKTRGLKAVCRMQKACGPCGLAPGIVSSHLESAATDGSSPHEVWEPRSPGSICAAGGRSAGHTS